jgi:hypothetical protein
MLLTSYTHQQMKVCYMLYDIYDINNRQKFNLCQLVSNSFLYQRGIHSFGTKVFNTVLSSIRSVTDNIKQDSYLHFHSFYSVGEKFNVIGIKINIFSNLR